MTGIAQLKKFYAFINNEPVTFEQMSVDFMQRFIIHLRTMKKFQWDKSKPSKPLSERTVINHLIMIRTIYNRAITAKLVSKDHNPFGGKGNISIKLTGAAKIGLEEAEIRKLEEVDLSEHLPIYEDTRNIWLTEFYFAGMRITDCLLLKWPD